MPLSRCLAAAGVRLLFATVLLAVVASGAPAQHDADALRDAPARVFPRQQDDGSAGKIAVIGATTRIGNLGLALSNLGYFGNLLNPTVSYPSCEYPLNSGVEHMFLGGLWVGGVDSEGDKRVTAGAEDTGSSSGSPKQELGPRVEDDFLYLDSNDNGKRDANEPPYISSNPLSPVFSTSAQADQHFEFSFDDFNGAGGGPADDPHFPLGVRVHCKALAYAPSYADDFVILVFEVENISGREITDLFVGWYNELSVGSTRVTPPGSSTNNWNFYDDINGFIGPGQVPGDPNSRIMYCYDQDGEGGAAESWIGIRLLGARPAISVFSYRQWRFGQIPRYDPDKYGFMSSGRLDVGTIDGVPYGGVGNWVSMIAVGPWEDFFPGDSVEFAIAFAAGADSTEMVKNSQVAQSTYDNGFDLPEGPPSPRILVSEENNRVVLRWKPGEEPQAGEYDATTASPEFHRSSFTNAYDFQGYRIYRILGEEIRGDPFQEASLLAEFDRREWPDGTLDTIGYNRGLPAMGEDGMRVFVDDQVLNGFDYWYSVTSFASRDPRLGLPELESGFNENSILVTPGSPVGAPNVGGPSPAVGVFPNPYRGASVFDDRFTSGEPKELGRNIYFTNVPSNAVIDVYNLSGARVDRLRREDATSGQVAWDMLSESTRALAPGLYVYVVENLDTGEIQRGKLVILK